MDQRLQVGVVDQRARHPHRVAEKEALVEHLPAREGAARHIPRQAIERDALARIGAGGWIVPLDIADLMGLAKSRSDGVAISDASCC